MKFESPAQLKECLIDYGVSNGYQLVFLVNDHNRLLVRCGKEETEEDGEGNRRKGIIEAVKDVFPYAKHRQCTRHIYANFKKKFRGLQFKILFWAAANSTTGQQFQEKMEELKTISKGAYTHLTERDPISWSRAFFEVGRACDAFENGMSESFNSRIRVARRKPIITMLEEIRTFVMHRIFLMATKAESLAHDVCPRIRKKKLEDIKKKQRHWKPPLRKVENTKLGFRLASKVLIWGCIRSNATLISSWVAGEVSEVFSTPSGRPSTCGRVRGMTLMVAVGLNMVSMRLTLDEAAKKEILIPG
ncbi:hypothetical protein L1987_22061 [Smallanthus sonchifolius]|uniref:Uncharacterized protein n=1 Tax=Smallanthus sonchifolius TaxID=185202 RepID=A0ACB9IDK2_9ASTR|nr:hypothetical protein L1987_22061 [Smallanthus sonchifolius]